MINLLLLVLMIGALAGMVFCGRGHKRRPELQLIALLLLVLVIASGGMFMCRLGALSVLGVEDTEQIYADADKKFRSAQGYVMANYIRNRFKNNKKVLLISSTLKPGPFDLALLGQLQDGKVGTLVHESFNAGVNADGLIDQAAERMAEARAIDAAVAKHPDAGVVILTDVSPSGETLLRLNAYRLPANKRPKFIVIGLSNLNEWVAEQLNNDIFAAVIITDATKFSMLTEQVPENPVEAFNRRYVLVTKDNLSRNRRYFH